MIAINRIIRTRRKTIALVVEHDGSLVVRAPLRTTERTIRQLVEKKADWIISKQNLVKTLYPPSTRKNFNNGDGFLYLGKIHRLEIVESKKPELILNGKFHLARTALPKARQVFERWYKRQADEVFNERVRLYAARYGFGYSKVKITSAHTRWGSCSGRGTLSFTWRLVMAPLAIIDYVVVHELVHIQVKNHSKEFWGRVLTLVPDYKQKVAWLKTNGNGLNLF
jgi:predicted metal-dependent hydrolase